MGSSTNSLSHLLSKLFQSSATALLLSIAVHYYKQEFSVPDQEPDCASVVGDSNLEDYWNGFYPFYLCEHQLPATKLFHFIGTFNVLFLLASMQVNGWSYKVRLNRAAHFLLELNKLYIVHGPL